MASASSEITAEPITLLHPVAEETVPSDAADADAEAAETTAPAALSAVEASEFLTLRGRRISYRSAGEAATAAALPVILAHGSASHSGQWRPLIGDLACARRVLAPDFHGYGRSDPTQGTEAPIFLHDAAILSELLTKQEQPAHLVGHSFGGLVAARVARDHPERVASLTLIEPTVFQLLEETGDPRRIELLETAAAVAALTEFGEPEKAMRMFIDFWNGDGAFDALGPEPQAYVVGVARRIADDFRGANLHAPGQMTYRDFQDIEPPTHLIYGAKSRASARAVMARLRNAMPYATSTEIDDASHMAAATEPERVNPIVIRFMDKTEQARSE
ncbi:MAG: alpha/beta hydrolase [Neomegalonema sp.]|nr:alpha/beta hydrolase [Neomegalonema sp.]